MAALPRQQHEDRRLIPTFRRPDLLINALDSLANQAAADFPSWFSDNDAEKTEGSRQPGPGSDRGGIGGRVHVTVPAQRGLSQNPNNDLALAFDRLGVDAVAMLDDDFEAHPRTDDLAIAARIFRTKCTVQAFSACRLRKAASCRGSGAATTA